MQRERKSRGNEGDCEGSSYTLIVLVTEGKCENEHFKKVICGKAWQGVKTKMEEDKNERYEASMTRY